MKVFAFAFVLFALVALGPTLPAEAFYGSCSEPGIYFFASPFPNSRSVSIVHALDALQSAGIDVTVAVSHAPQLIVVINATADHVLTADFLPTDAAYSNIQVTITDQFGTSGSSQLAASGRSSLALTLAAAGLVTGATTGKPGMSVASIAAGAAVGLGLFGPMASAESTKCANSWVHATVYIPGSVVNYTVNATAQQCNLPYFTADPTNPCSICNSQFPVPPSGILYPCMNGTLSCCPGEVCVPYEVAPTVMSTKCCGVSDTACQGSTPPPARRFQPDMQQLFDASQMNVVADVASLRARLSADEEDALQ